MITKVKNGFCGIKTNSYLACSIIEMKVGESGITQWRRPCGPTCTRRNNSKKPQSYHHMMHIKNGDPFKR